MDPVLVTGDCDCGFAEVIDIENSISDHQATKVYVTISDVIHKTYQRLVWYYKDADFLKFNNLISSFDWNLYFLEFGDDIDTLSIKFTDKYLEFAKESIPSKVVTVHENSKPWFNSGIER